MAKLTRTATLLAWNSVVMSSPSFTQSLEGVSWNWLRLNIMAMEIRIIVIVPMMAMVQTVRLTESDYLMGTNHELRITNHGGGGPPPYLPLGEGRWGTAPPVIRDS